MEDKVRRKVMEKDIRCIGRKNVLMTKFDKAEKTELSGLRNRSIRF
jgi:hypothetical protein